MRFKIAAVLILAMVLLITYAKKEGLFIKKDQTYESLFGNIAKISKTTGVRNAYNLVVYNFENGKYDINKCHSLMHILGHAAYEFNGNNFEVYKNGDMSKCMDGFWHGVEAQIVLEELVDPERMSLSIKNFCKFAKGVNPKVECYHGAGHAFVQKGFSTTLALEQCDRIISDGYEDCYRGVFSEHVNLLRGIDGDSDSVIPGVIPIKLGQSEIFKECLIYDSKYKNACVSQFSVFVSDIDGLEAQIKTCELYNTDISSVCVLKVAANYASGNLSNNAELTIPRGFSGYGDLTRRSYIEGIVGQYIHHFGPNGGVLDFCKKLEVENDKKYCLSEVSRLQ